MEPVEVERQPEEGQERFARAIDVAARLLDNIETVVYGKREEVKLVVAALMCGGHVLLEDVPGTAKTVLARAIGGSIEGVTHSRIQCTPDLQPTDVTGLSVFDQKTRDFEFRPGPIFTNVLLVDEINRATPKTQSALLEAMQEHRVTVQGKTYQLHEPFYVFATQNPIELEGTYPLPEAQLDRFMFHIIIEHPPYDEELEVTRTTTAIQNPQLERPITGEDLIAFQRLVRKVPVSEPVLRHALDIVRATRSKNNPDAKDFIKKWVAFGASVRAAQYLVLGGKARALTSGRYHVSFEDIRALTHPVLRHRIITNFHAQSEGVTTDQIVDRLLEVVPLPRSGM
jgi:MoxR-like ATPase